MKLIRLSRLRLRSLLFKKNVEQELDDELRFHIEEKMSQLQAAGLSPEAARRQAAREFGNLTLHAEHCRDTRKTAWFEAIVSDIRYSARALWKDRGFSFVSIASLAIGIGALTAMFAVFDVAVLRPLSIANADRLIWFREYTKGGEEAGGNPQRLKDWIHLQTLQSVAGFYDEGAILTGRGNPVRLEGLLYLGALPQALSAQVQLGRLPTAAEVDHGEPVLVLSDAAWHKLFNADRQAIGRSLRLSNQNCQIVGVLRSSVDYPPDADFWKPMPADVQQSTRAAGFLAQVALLAPGRTVSQAQAEVNATLPQLAKREPATDSGRKLQLQPLADHISGESRASLLLFLMAAASVLVIACINLAGLLLARGLNRQRESSIRVALGAGSFRLIRLFLIEAFLLAVLGCCGGLLSAAAFLKILQIVLPAETPHLLDASFSLRVLSFTALVTLASAIVSGLLPAWKSARHAIATGLKKDAAGSIGTGSRLRSVLVIGQIAVSLALLIGAGLLLASFTRLAARPLGFNTERIFTFALNFPWDTPTSTLRSNSHRVLEQLAQAPGIDAAGVVDRLPLHGGSQSRRLLLEDGAVDPALDARQFGWRLASTGYFTAARIPLRVGELYRDGDRNVCVISQALSSVLFGQRNPIGHRLASRTNGHKSPQWLRIVGVIGDTRIQPLEVAGTPEVYLPFDADYWPMLNFVVHTNLNGTETARLIRQIAATAVPDQVIDNVASLENVTSATRRPFRNRAFLALSLAAIAVTLSGIGLFALLARDSALRTKEYGLRAAFGAHRSSLAFDAMKRTLWLTIPGILLGFLLSVALSHQLRAFLFDLQPFNPLTYLIASAVLLAVALIAALLPALEAARVDPLVVLRHD